MQQYMSHDIGAWNELVIIYDLENGEKNCALVTLCMGKKVGSLLNITIMIIFQCLLPDLEKNLLPSPLVDNKTDDDPFFNFTNQVTPHVWTSHPLYPQAQDSSRQGLS